MLTPHLPGRAAALPWLRPRREPAAALRQLQAAWRSAVVLKAPRRPLTPLQQAGGGAPPFVRKGMHGARALFTWPHDMAFTIGAPTMAMHTSITNANLRLAINYNMNKKKKKK
ncbi:uncharacterized protein DS421_12g377300 [Arachis hypogaea]|nr:uncharacterized protein DS421_12g377300 [Arachis hypogaea]